MDPTEFDALAEPLRERSAAMAAEHGFSLIEGRTATAEEITAVELSMGVVLPDKYKAFMMRHGGGMFGFLDLFPIVSTPGRYDDLETVNDDEFPDRGFVVVSPVGTGDHWGFPVTDGRCHDAVWFHFHDDPDDELVAADFLEFVAEHGLKSSADRALERRD
ncbi:SMI1/KNR4 family protein [Actinoplanes sp. CA-252034]|uniref:SMI1/KNR4 family protein n=1 Tax=Actinoplanes sp. CA-252034 TaxID=3239906 RepID=UPI003D98AD04